MPITANAPFLSVVLCTRALSCDVKRGVIDGRQEVRLARRWEKEKKKW